MTSSYQYHPSGRYFEKPPKVTMTSCGNVHKLTLDYSHCGEPEPLTRIRRENEAAELKAVERWVK